MSSEPEINEKEDQISAASFLPVIATYNLRSLMPKISSLKTDLVERKIDVAFLQEVWEPYDSPLFIAEIEKYMAYSMYLNLELRHQKGAFMEGLLL